jgi:hypothetical protein
MSILSNKVFENNKTEQNTININLSHQVELRQYKSNSQLFYQDVDSSASLANEIAIL